MAKWSSEPQTFFTYHYPTADGSLAPGGIFYATEARARKAVENIKKARMRNSGRPSRPYSIVKVETIPITKAVLAELLSDSRRNTPYLIAAEEVIEDAL